MALQLNDEELSSSLSGHPYRTAAIPYTPGKVYYREFFGRNVDQMPNLLREGFIPLSVAGLMQRRLEVLNSNVTQEVRDSWWDNYFDTGDGIFYSPDGKVKIITNAQQIRELNPKTPLLNGALVLDKNLDDSILAYSSLDGMEFTRSDLEKCVGRLLTKDEAKNNSVWRVLAGGDQALLNEYVDVVFSEGKRKFKREEGMGIYIICLLGSIVAVGWPLSIYELGNASFANDGDGADYKNGRLVWGINAGDACACSNSCIKVLVAKNLWEMNT